MLGRRALAHADRRCDSRFGSAAGELICGVSQGLFGFSERKADGTWTGFDVDVCRAIAAAVLADPAKVSFLPLSASERFIALREGKIDVLSRNSTWTLEREAGLGLLFAGINFHDGQGFMVHRDLKVTSALELNEAKFASRPAPQARPS